MKRTLLAVAGLLSLSSFADTTEFIPLQQFAQGQSLTGASLLNDSLFSNPAASAFTQAYSVDGTYMTSRAFAVSVLDTRTSAIGGGLGYYRIINPGTLPITQGGRLSLFGRLSNHIGVGLLGKGAWGPDMNGVSAKLLDADGGVIAHMGWFQAGATVTNLLGGNTAMGATRGYSLGVRASWEETLFISAAIIGQFAGMTPVQYGFGAEYVSPYYFSLKGGYRTRPLDRTSFWSAGFSIIAPKISIHYAAQFPNQPGSIIEHSVGTTIMF